MEIVGESGNSRQAVERYISSTAYGLIETGELKPGGSTKEVTCLIIRMHGMFRAFSNPGDDTLFVNAFGKESFPIIYGKDLDGEIVRTFSQDAVEIVFGLTAAVPNHPLQAVTTALALRDSLKGFKDVTSDIEITMGVNTGEAFCGYVGSPERFDYGAYGDTIRIGHILAESAHNIGYDILIGETTYSALRRQIAVRGSQRLAVPRGEPILGYRLEGITISTPH
ncbi:MAG: adenylate/guanylate cyclase domain-containing protein [Patescibacteria group bacterium]